MKIVLDEIIVRKVEVPMPDDCPKCGEPWRAHGVIEAQVVAASQSVSVFREVDAHGRLRFDDYGSPDLLYEDHYVEGYLCVNCGADLVTLPFEDEEKPGLTIKE